jgi:hypothetical protein
MTSTISFFQRSYLRAYSAIFIASRKYLSFISWNFTSRVRSWRVLFRPPPNEQHIDFVRRSYEEDEIWEKGMEPRRRSLRLVYRSRYLIWHIKVTYKGTLQYDVCGYARSCRKSTLPDILRNLPQAEQKVGTALHNRPLCAANKIGRPLAGEMLLRDKLPTFHFRLSLLLSLRSTQNEPLQFLAKTSKGNPLLLRNC